ncbi:MAG TPA: hypothetical protein VMS65_00735 [Polyangiaceae bacterium]|nr:hypothetical protein [Polyangiaceae bacterium]
MNQPRRLLDDNPTGLERELLTAGTSYRSSSSARQQTLAALGLVGTAAASASVAAASSSAVQKLGLLKILTVAGIGVAVLTPIGLIAWKKLDAPAERAAVAVAQPAEPAVPAPRAAPPPPVAPVETSEAPPPDVPAPKADARAASSGVLSAELGLLDVARSKLGGGDARGALVVLDEYARTFPRGRLGLEAEVLRIDALSRAGETAAAKRRAEAFLKRHPKSVLAQRVRRYLDEPR